MGADVIESTNAAILYAQHAAAAAAAAANGTDSKPLLNLNNGGAVLNGHYYSAANGNPTDQATTSTASTPEDDGGELRTNLIINYLPQNMNQDEVRALFASMGEIESCKLVRDKVTGQSLGYAFVNYVSFARPSNECIKGANLYVSGMPKTMTLKELVEIFRPYGKIITSRILFDNVTGISKGVGFVRFDKKQEAEYAIEKVHGTTPPGFTEPIAVKFANSPGARDRAVLQQMASNLTNLGALGTPVAAPLTAPISAAQAALLPLTTAVLRRNGATSVAGNGTGAGGPMRHAGGVANFRYSPLGVPTTSLGLGGAGQDLFTTNALLQMAAAGNAAVAQQAQLAALAAAVPCSVAGLGFSTATQVGQAVNNNGCGVPTARSTSPSGGFTIIVANLGAEAEESLLWRLFGPFGAVLSVKTVKDAADRCRGFGLVTMANYDEACAAVTTLNGAAISGRTVQVSFKSSNPASL
uniref:ELAV protein 2 n=1 Tax=Panagrellus redivivus TaxID=6233 RepID=A0A7E4ZQN2_PANRE